MFLKPLHLLHCEPNVKMCFPLLFNNVFFFQFSNSLKRNILLLGFVCVCVCAELYLSLCEGKKPVCEEGSYPHGYYQAVLTMFPVPSPPLTMNKQLVSDRNQRHVPPTPPPSLSLRDAANVGPGTVGGPKDMVLGGPHVAQVIIASIDVTAIAGIHYWH